MTTNIQIMSCWSRGARTALATVCRQSAGRQSALPWTSFKTDMIRCGPSESMTGAVSLATACYSSQQSTIKK